MHISEFFNLSGKIAIVTRASRGIGKEIVKGLGIECLTVRADVSKLEDVRRFVAEALRWGKIDILISNTWDKLGNTSGEYAS